MVFGQFVYVLQGPAQPTARRRLRVRKIGDFDADFCELPLQAHTLLGPLPVVSLEEDVEPQVPPDLELVVRRRRMRRVNMAAVAHDLDSLGERNNRCDSLVGDQNLVRYDAGDQIIAAFLGSPKQIEMPDVKKVECAWRVPNADRDGGFP